MADAKNNPKRAYKRHGDWKTRFASEDERFWEKVDKTGDCWIWMAARLKPGYGYFASDLESYAHRWSYRKLVGEIPAGYQIDHLCRVTSCVNPAHLEAVTPEENLARKNALVLATTHCRRGHEYTAENTKVSRKTGARTCITCRRLMERTRAARRRAIAEVITGDRVAS